MLIALRDYLIEHRRAELHTLAARFDVPPEIMLDLLRTWVAKGKVRQSAAVRCAHTCAGCAAGAQEVYEWVGG